MSTALAPTRSLSLESFSAASGLHPDVVRRFVALGLIEVVPSASGELRFPPAQLAAAFRIKRLRAGLGVNYAALGVVMDLLDRIAELEAALRRLRSVPTGGSTWT